MSGSSGWTADRRARAALSCTVEAGDLEVARRMATGTAEDVWQAARDGELGPGPAARAAVLDLDQVLRRARAASVRYVVPGDDEWPVQLGDLALGVDDERRFGGVPVGLWLRGPLALTGAVRSSVSIVGSRASTAYGEGVASDLAVGLCDARVSVISGGAFGIDAAAHRGALAAGGCSIAVLACGVDVAYPKANSRMFDWLAADHLLVSELPPGAHPTRNRFLTRNRLIAALAQGVVVVEAALRSGARNTATWAGRCGRTLMAVPGPVSSAMSEAPHLMIRDQQATLVTSAAEVLELISPMGVNTVTVARGEQRPTDALSVNQLALFEALPARRWVGTDELSLASGLPVNVCLAELGALEDEGLVRSGPHGWRLG